MKKIFAISVIFLICAVGKTATDSNNTVVSDSNITAEPNTNTTADCQERIKKLEKAVKSQQRMFDKLTITYNNIKEQLDEQIIENERLRALLKDYIADSVSFVLFTGEETPLTMVRAYLERYVGKTFIVIGRVEVGGSYSHSHNFDEARGTYISLGFSELTPKNTLTGEGMELFVRKEMSEDLITDITKTIYRGQENKLIRAKVKMPSPYEPSITLEAELIDWQFLSADKKWGAWQCPTIKGR